MSKFKKLSFKNVKTYSLKNTKESTYRHIYPLNTIKVLKINFSRKLIKVWRIYLIKGMLQNIFGLKIKNYD